jgi:endonuclease/exonuclease/phosphatase family metal-dependent hydrolase
MNKYTIKILTLNIHKGWSLGKRKNTLEKIKKNILSSGANLACLQEVVGAYPDLAKKSQFEFLADQIWPHYAYGKNAVYSKGHHGNAILSQIPFVKFENFDISSYPIERRGILHTEICLPNYSENLHVMTLHLDLLAWSRKKQIAKLCHLIDLRVPKDSPLIVCGDFNDWGEEVSFYLNQNSLLQEAHFLQTGSHAKTFPTVFPILKLDRLYFRNLKLKHISRPDTDSWHELSDHLPLYAEFGQL